MEENFEEVISIEEILNSLKKRWKLIFICTVIVATIAAAITMFLIKPKYETSTKLFVGKEQGSTEAYNSSEVQMYQQLLKTYAEVIKTRDVAKGAIEKAKVDMTPENLLRGITVVTMADTQILEIKYEGLDPVEGLKLTNAVKEEFIKVAVDLVPNGNIQVLEEPELPKGPSSPNVMMNIVIGVLLGFMGGVGICFLIEFMDNTFKSKEQLEKELDLPVLGLIPKNEEEKGARRSAGRKHSKKASKQDSKKASKKIAS